jgi:hypothetical protein
MEIFESVIFVAIGFVPTLLAMEAGWKMAKKSFKLEVAKIGIR